MLDLYHFNGATCGLKARLALAEKGVAYTPRALTREALRQPEYLALNPNGVVPTLVHDGQVLCESSVIINYIDDAFDGPALKPGTPLGTARVWWWMKRADECLSPIGILTYTISMRPKIIDGKSPAELAAYIDGMPNAAARVRRRAILELGYENPAFQQAMADIETMLTEMEQVLTQSDWLAGDSYSLADTAMTPLVERLEELNMADMLGQNRTRLPAWWARIQARASYRSCLVDMPNPERPQHFEAGTRARPQIEAALQTT